MPIKAVFFDSGHTLMRPIDNRWFPGLRFFEICNDFEHAVPDDDALQRACDLGYAYLDRNHHDVPDEDAERWQFAEYYRLIFDALDHPAPEELIGQLARSAISDVNFEPYPDTRQVLDTIVGLGVPMALLTDAWPSVRSKFKAIGYLHYFAAFVISAEQRCNKPDMGMFRPALAAIGVAPGEVLFVDDGPDLVETARGNGFNALVIDHENRHPQIPDRITSLRQILGYLND